MKNGKISTETAIQALNYSGPVFERNPIRMDPMDEHYPALKRMVGTLKEVLK